MGSANELASVALKLQRQFPDGKPASLYDLDPLKVKHAEFWQWRIFEYQPDKKCETTQLLPHS
jgi:hypothetical protein